MTGHLIVLNRILHGKSPTLVERCDQFHVTKKVYQVRLRDVLKQVEVVVSRKLRRLQGSNRLQSSIDSLLRSCQACRRASPGKVKRHTQGDWRRLSQWPPKWTTPTNLSSTKSKGNRLYSGNSSTTLKSLTVAILIASSHQNSW